MRLSISLPLLAALALTACNKGGAPSSDAASSGGANGKAIAAVQSGLHLQPGLYSSKVEITQFDMPGVPPGALGMIKARMAEKQVTYCLTPADAARGAEAMKERMSKGKCQFGKFDAAGGQIDAVMSCQMGTGTLKVVSKGTFTDTGTVTQGTADMTMPGGKGMHMATTTVTQRVGDCSK